jgi:hypothetical protein
VLFRCAIQLSISSEHWAEVTYGIALLVEAVMPLGDMSIILGSGESKSRGDACRRPFVDPCHLREMPLTVLVDREGRIAISHAGVVDPLVFETDISALPRVVALLC